MLLDYLVKLIRRTAAPGCVHVQARKVASVTVVVMGCNEGQSMPLNVLIGERLRFTGPFLNLLTNTLSDPTTVSVIVKAPPAFTGVETTYVYGTDVEVVKDKTGQYHIDITFDIAGDWAVRFKGAGAVVAANEYLVKVSAGAMIAP